MSGLRPHSSHGIHIILAIVFLSSGTIGRDLGQQQQQRGGGHRDAKSACSQNPSQDCMFYFEGATGSAPYFTAGNGYASKSIYHRNGTVGFLDLHGGGPCKTSASPDACKYFQAISPPPPPKRGNPPFIVLKPKTKAIIKSVSGKCFQLYVGRVAVKVGGAKEWTVLEWENEHSYFPKKKRCVVFNVS